MRKLIILISLFVYASCGTKDYKHKRAKLLQDEFLLTLGGKVNLTDKEIAVNKCLMKHKENELDYGFDHPEHFNLSHHYFSYRESIKQSKVYKILKEMPKGAALHVHDMGILGPDYLMNITYMEHLYVCFGSKLLLQFSLRRPDVTCTGKWQLMSEARRLSNNVTKFDAELRKHFTLVVDNPDIVYPSITETWKAFMDYFITVAPMLSYRPLWEQYFYDALKKFRESNILYVEVRSILPNLYELDGTVYSPLITAMAYRKTIKTFLDDYPDFVGAKLIYAPSRKVETSTVNEYLELAKLIKKDMPDFFAGFDLVGQEDLGNPLVDFVPPLLGASKELNYFFHAGETDWSGLPTDENLVDAILLGTKRIGHAYALLKHPLLLREVVFNDIGLEVNVVSNTVLSLVRDVRNHPLSLFLALDLPVVLSSDDPGIWEADVITDDFYLAFVAVSSKHSDIRMLKTLAMNSLKYSALNETSKIAAFNKFNTQWNKFVNEFDCSKY
ncbi:adenosine deaminase 2-like [Ostrinia nubilalis]|uniref:adenosine deaminase 2-like n=1 Tax=Ostrinia nubilalis TaxID=29057 RepID=UPI00308252B1